MSGEFEINPVIVGFLEAESRKRAEYEEICAVYAAVAVLLASGVKKSKAINQVADHFRLTRRTTWRRFEAAVEQIMVNTAMNGYSRLSLFESFVASKAFETES